MAQRSYERRRTTNIDLCAPCPSNCSNRFVGNINEGGSTSWIFRRIFRLQCNGFGFLNHHSFFRILLISQDRLVFFFYFTSTISRRKRKLWNSQVFGDIRVFKYFIWILEEHLHELFPRVFPADSERIIRELLAKNPHSERVLNLIKILLEITTKTLKLDEN